jgi:hypothetical protein
MFVFDSCVVIGRRYYLDETLLFLGVWEKLEGATLLVELFNIIHCSQHIAKSDVMPEKRLQEDFELLSQVRIYRAYVNIGTC